MNQIKEFFVNLFEHDLWPPRWHCGYWSDFHGWLYILSDVAIWAAYFTIPIIILRYTGIGLALVKRIVETNGGYILVESEIGDGSTFRIFLPIK